MIVPEISLFWSKDHPSSKAKRRKKGQRNSDRPMAFLKEKYFIRIYLNGWIATKSSSKVSSAWFRCLSKRVQLPCWHWAYSANSELASVLWTHVANRRIGIGKLGIFLFLYMCVNCLSTVCREYLSSLGTGELFLGCHRGRRRHGWLPRATKRLECLFTAPHPLLKPAHHKRTTEQLLHVVDQQWSCQ